MKAILTIYFIYLYITQVVLMVENLLANAGDVRDMGSVPG